MKKAECWLICLMCVIITFSSCNLRKAYTVDFPDIYTKEYCVENYVRADPNLLHIDSSDNYIGPTEHSGRRGRYRAIKDVRLDEYLLLDQTLIFTTLMYEIVKNKNNTSLPQQEILSWNVKSVIIYAKRMDLDEPDKITLGDKMVDEVIASLNGQEAVAFQNHLIDCYENGNYFKNKAGYDVVYPIRVRVVFEGYENLVWDADVSERNGIYYIGFYVPYMSEKYTRLLWEYVYLPLNQKISELISKDYKYKN